MVEIKFRIKFKVSDGSEMTFELSEGEARELHRVLDGIVGEKRGTTYIPFPYFTYPVPHVPIWQPIWTSGQTGDPLPPGTQITCYSVEMLV